MALQGPLSAGAGANVAGGNTDWVNPSNVTASDDARATVVLTLNALSDMLLISSFGFAIPTTATILGIVVEIEKSYDGAGTIEDLSVLIAKGGSGIGTEHLVGGAWSTPTDAFQTYGTSTDLWGVTWTPADINAAGFGVQISAQEVGGTDTATARVDFARITVYYTLAGRSYAAGFIGT